MSAASEPDLLGRASAALSAGDTSSAEQLAHLFLDRHPRDPDGLNLLGVLRHARGDYIEAERVLSVAAACAPTSAGIWSNLAMVQVAAGRHERAVDSASRAVSLTPAHPQAQYFLGLACEALGRREDALAAFRTALASRPSLSPAREALYRHQEPSAADIQWLESMAWAWPGTLQWTRDLAHAVSVKLSGLIKRGNFAQVDILRLASRSAGRVPEPRDAALKDAVASAFGLPIDLPKPMRTTGIQFIRAWGQGFWSDVDHVLSQLLLAEIAGRIPVVHWGANSLYGGSESEDAFGFFFEPIRDRIPSAEDWTPGRVYPPKWLDFGATGLDVNQWSGPFSRQSALGLLGRPEEIVVADFHTQINQLADWIPRWHRLHNQPVDTIYRDLVDCYLRPQAALISAADDFVAANFGSRHFVALHLRGLDKAVECHDIASVNTELIDRVAGMLETEPQLMVFGLTDDLDILENLRRRFGERLIVSDCRRARGVQGLHFLDGQPGRRLGEEILLDSLVACRAECFVGLGTSNVASMIGHFKPWRDGKLFLKWRRPHECFMMSLYDW